MLFIFIVGGILFVTIDYVVNNLNDTSLGALISMVPIGFLSTIIIKDYNNLIQYTRNMFFVICITLTLSLLFYILLKVFRLNKSFTISFIFILWMLLQSINYKFNNLKNEPLIIDETDLKLNNKSNKNNKNS